MKSACLLLCLGVFSGAICAETTDGCDGLQGAALTLCHNNQQTLQLQQQLEQQLQQQQERQNQLDKQQREVQQQLETMRQQNQALQKELEREAAHSAVGPVAAAASTRNADLKSWKADNPWYGTDYARTQFATRYLKQLEKERPDLVGRELLNAVSSKVNETFGPSH